MEGLISLRSPGSSISVRVDSPFMHPCHRSVTNVSIRRSVSGVSMENNRLRVSSLFPIRAQQEGLSVASSATEDRDNAFRIKEWEVGMYQDELASSQGISVRRRKPTKAPLGYVGPFELRLQNKVDSPRDVLEEIIWYKDEEVSRMKEKTPFLVLNKAVENAPPPNQGLCRGTSGGSHKNWASQG